MQMEMRLIRRRILRMYGTGTRRIGPGASKLSRGTSPTVVFRTSFHSKMQQLRAYFSDRKGKSMHIIGESIRYYDFED